MVYSDVSVCFCQLRASDHLAFARSLYCLSLWAWTSGLGLAQGAELLSFKTRITLAILLLWHLHWHASDGIRKVTMIQSDNRNTGNCLSGSHIPQEQHGPGRIAYFPRT